VTGPSAEIGGELTSNPTVRKLTFTGSTEVGKIADAATSALFGKSLGLEIRHRGIPRGQVPLHGRHRLVSFG
jgi:hypothetical protein